jgi:lysophospholipase L1-like esterase
MNNKSVKNSWRVYILLPVASILITSCALELLMIIFYPVPYAFEINGEYESDPYTCWKVKPNYSGFYLSGTPVCFNSLGLNDKEITFNKKDGTFRILVLGDSFTAGTNLRREQAYPRLLETLLNKNSPLPVEVINAGVDGYDPWLYAQYYEHYGRKIEHDMVLVGLCIGNDIYGIGTNPDISMCPQIVLGRRVFTKYIILAKLKIFFYKNSNIIRLLMNKTPPVINFTRKDCNDISDFSIWINKLTLDIHRKKTRDVYLDAKNAVDQIKRIKYLADQNSIPLVIALLPDEKQINKTLQNKIMANRQINLYDFSMPQSMLNKMFEEIGVKTVDLLPAFLKSTDCLYMNDTHFSPAGQSLAAATIAHEITGLVRAD